MQYRKYTRHYDGDISAEVEQVRLDDLYIEYEPIQHHEHQMAVDGLELILDGETYPILEEVTRQDAGRLASVLQRFADTGSLAPQPAAQRVRRHRRCVAHSGPRTEHRRGERRCRRDHTRGTG